MATAATTRGAGTNPVTVSAPVPVVVSPVSALMLFNAASSFGFGLGLIVAPQRAWRVFGAEAPKESTVSTACYGAAVFGEGVLQLFASALPEVFLPAVIVFMVPYKLASAAALGFAYARGHVAKRDAVLVSVQWVGAIAAIAGALRWERALATRNGMFGSGDDDLVASGPGGSVAT